MGTKTEHKKGDAHTKEFSEKRIPKHGDENAISLSSIFISSFPVEKESPNMGTSEFKILFLLFFDKMAICMLSCYN